MAKSSSTRFLNLGCGSAFSKDPEWTNIDISPHPGSADHVGQYQLALGIPYPEGSFNAVYHSHMLEHFPRAMVLPFLRECLRVLRPGGTLRVVVPDLESILRQYIISLDEARQNVPGAKDRLQWMQVELLDQLVRKKSGGCMAKAWESADEATASFIRSRLGNELDNIPRKPENAPLSLPEEPLSLPLIDKNFLESGECHQWMYDEVTLTTLLEKAGFIDIRVVDFKTSAIPGFNLDSNDKGQARKLDSLYIEAKRSEQSAQILGPIAPCFSTTDKGGAGIAAMRIHEGLRKSGLPSIAYVQHKRGKDRNIYVLPPTNGDIVLPDGAGGAFLASRQQEQLRQANSLAAYPERPAGCEAFSSSEAGVNLQDIPALENSDIIHLHWVAGFIDVPRNVEFLKNKKIIWTLHDMNPFTGGCHYAGNCAKYQTKCGACPQLGSCKEKDLSYRTWQRKEYAYRNLDITVVAPSRWLASEAAKSSLFGRFPVHHIPYGIPTEVFKPYKRDFARQLLEIPTDARVLLFSAENILNRRKGFAYLLDALKHMAGRPAAQNLTLAVMGSGGEFLKDLPYSIKVLGTINNPEIMAIAYSAADALVLPTLEDNLPNVLLESLACGTPAVSFRVGGVPDIIEDGKTGWLANPCDVGGLAKCLETALQDDNPQRRDFCRTSVLEKFSVPLMAERYTKLYEDLLIK